MSSTHVEIETKYELAPGQPLPDLIGVGGVTAVAAQAEMVLTAIYYDTGDLALAGTGATLRHRSGGTDDGWHLKLKLGGGERLEVTRPLTDEDHPPSELVELVRGLSRGGALSPVATLVNRRTVHHLLGDDGQPLAELADDSVNARRHDGDDPPLAWRELEIELVTGTRAALAALDSAVQASGITPASSESKLARLLDDAAAPTVTSRQATVSDVVDAGLAAAVRELQATDPLLRLDRPGAAGRAHDALRRLQAALAVARQVLPDQRHEQVRTGVDRLDLVLAPLAELETSAAGTLALVADERPEQVAARLVAQLDAHVMTERGPLVEPVRAALDSVRYTDLLADLLALSRRGHRVDAANASARSVLPELAHRSLQRVERRIAQLVRAESGDEVTWLIAGSRRAVGRATFPGLLGVDGRSSRAQDLADLLSQIDSSLTALEWAIPAQALLLSLAEQSQRRRQSSFVHGRLHARAEQICAENLSLLAGLRKDLRRRRKS